MLDMLITFVAILGTLQASQGQTVPLRRFEVIRIDSVGLNRVPPSLRGFFAGPIPDRARPVASAEEAQRQLGFVPRLPAVKMPPDLLITDRVRADERIAVADITEALQQAKVGDVSVPQTWDGVTVGLEQGAGLIADYGQFFIAQAPLMTLAAPPGFAVDQFLEVLFRIAGINAADARNLRQKFAAGPAVYFPIPPRYEMDIREVQLTTGSGLLLQNADKGGELAFMWSTSDRSYFLSGIMTEDEAIATANSLR
jgi:hypothetical protein